MKHVNAYPFVGKDYEKGFLNSGKKVLLLGLSHYNEENAGAPCTIHLLKKLWTVL